MEFDGIDTEIATARLTLIAMTAEALAAEQGGRLAEAIGCGLRARSKAGSAVTI